MTEPTTAPPRTLIPLLGLSAFLVGWDSMVVAPIAPAIMTDLNATGQVASLLVAAYALAYFLFSPIFGALSDKIGRKTVLVTGLVVFSVGTLLTGLMDDWWLVLAMRALAGIGGGMIMPSVFSLASDNTPMEKRGKTIGNVMAMMLASTIIGVPLGSWLADITSWRWVFGIIAALGLIVTIAAAVAIPSAEAPHQIPVSAPRAVAGMLGTAFRTPILLLTLAATFCWNAGLQTVFSSIGAFYHDQLGFTESDIALVILAAGIASVVGSMLGGRLIQRLGLKVLIGTVSVGAALGVAVLVLGVPYPVPVIAANVVWSLCIGMGQPALTTLVSELRPELRGTALALNGSTQYAAMFAASLLGGVLATATGNYLLAGAISVLFALATGVVIAVVTNKMRGDAASATKANPGEPS